MFAIGVYIGGTRCAICLGKVLEERVDILHECGGRKTRNTLILEFFPWENI